VDKVVEQVRHWRNELLNLSRRDRVLYYKPTRTASVVVDGPSAAEVVSWLRRNKRTGWRFFNPPDEVDSEGEEATATSPVARQSDELLTQKTDRKSLEAALRTLDRRTTQEFMDKGIWVLYLAVGFLEWMDPDTEDSVRTPVVLLPVNLIRASPRDPFRLVLAEEDAVVNPALAVRMDADFGVRLPELPDIDELDIATFLDEVVNKVRKRGWTVSPDLAIDVFSFHKEVMYRDLKENEEEICANEIIRALALGEHADVDLSFEPPNEDDLDELHPPEQLATIRDADASQRRCIVASRAGNSFVMDGPPGTGKSQTISNIIAQAMVDGKTVLFVSEKIAALEVVKSRLDEVGLGEYLLELHSHKSTRREVAQTLYRSLTYYPSPKNMLRAADVTRLASRRRELSAYASAMNEVRQPLGMSLHHAIGRVARVNDLPQAPLSSLSLSALDSLTLDRILTRTADLSRAWGPVLRGDDFLWRGAASDFASARGKRDAVDRIGEARSRLVALRSVSTDIAEDLELWWNEAPLQAAGLLEVLKVLVARRDIPASWLTEGSLKATSRRLRSLRDTSRKYSESTIRLEEMAGPDWRGVSPTASAELEVSAEALSANGLNWPLADTEDVGRIHEALRFAKASESALEEMQRIGDDLGTRLGVGTDGITLARCGVLSELSSLLGMANPPEGDWLDGVSLARVQDAATVLGSLVERYRAKGEVLKEIYKPSVLDLDLHALKVRFDTLHTGIRKLGGAYRTDKRLLAEHTYTGKLPKGARAALGDALEWKEIADSLREAEGRHAERLGEHYYHGSDTRFDEVSEAIAVAGRATELAGQLLVDRDRFKAQIARGDRWEPAAKSLGEDLAARSREWLERAVGIFSVPSESLETITFEDLLDRLRFASPHLSTAWQVVGPVEQTAGQTLTFGEVREIAAVRRSIAEAEADVVSAMDTDRQLLGERYRGLDSDWENLDADRSWAESLRSATGGSVDAITAGRLLETAVGPDGLEAVAKDWIEARDFVGGLFLGERASELNADLESSYEDGVDLLDRLEHSVRDIDEWSAHIAACNDLAELGLADAVSFAIRQKLTTEQLVPALERATLESWIDRVLAEDEALVSTRSQDRDAIVEEFRRLDGRIIGGTVASVMTIVNSRRPQTSLGPAGVISKEGMKKRRHMPVRDLLRETAAITQVIKPCFMMSPLSVSQFLTPDLRFDLVIFDEASQVRPSDAANCIYRGSQLIVAGDQKQLPPTDFFQRISMDGDDEYTEDQVAEFESVLDLGKAGGMESLPLRWHYRSQHESLITYSNYSFYEGRLITFPGALDEAPDVGVVLYPVDGVYRRGGARDNVIEAEKVAERVLFHARNHPHLTLGVVAFSEAQASTIEYVLDQQRSRLPELDDYFAEDRLHGFFVKNLENVQGDERDLMIFSIGYGPDEVGKTTMNFGPLNRPGGWRRLNVAVTRARRRVEVVTSILPEQFQPTSNDGPRHLQRYLDFARRGMSALALDIAESESDSESPFEEEVVRVIRSWGYEARPQVGVASYRVDVGVVDPAKPGRYVLGVECDGAMYHSSKVARDRDRLRQEVLEGLDWTIYRIWGTAWYQDRQREEEKLREAIEASSSGQKLRRQIKPHDPTEVELMTSDLRATPDWVVSYEVHRPVVPRYREIQDSGSIPAIAEAIREVVSVEGPVAKEVVLRRVREAWGIGRAGSQVRSAFDTALGRSNSLGVRKDRRNFLWTATQVAAGDEEALSPVRQPTTDPDSLRKITEIAPEERRAAILHLVSDARRATWDELSAAISSLFGWNRRGSQIAEELDKDVRSLLRSGALVRDGSQLTLPPDRPVAGQ
jgi:very-short-patch-repair endonuclease